MNTNEKLIWDGNAETANNIFGESFNIHWRYVTNDSQAIKVGNKVYEVGDEISPYWKNDLLKHIASPLIKFLNDYYHPHAKAIVHTTGAEILEGLLCTPEITEFILD